MKKIGKVILKIVFVIIGIVLLFLLFLFIKSPGKLSSLVDEKGNLIANAIVEKNKTEIGGIQQGFFIRGENPKNPVILFLHGGPEALSFH